jgi:hypothetical protein
LAIHPDSMNISTKFISMGFDSLDRKRRA